MLPFQEDEIWNRIIHDPERAKFTSMPTRMMMMRVVLITKVRTPKNMQSAKEIIYRFFSSNEKTLVEDVEILLKEYGSRR